MIPSCKGIAKEVVSMVKQDELKTFTGMCSQALSDDVELR